MANILNYRTKKVLDNISFNAVVYSSALLLVLLVLIPVIFAISVSVRPPGMLFSDKLIIIPPEISWRGWNLAWNDLKDGLMNSAIVATLTTIVSLVVTIPGAYAFSRTEFPGQDYVFYFIIMAVMFPFVLLIIPIADLWYMIGLYNTIPGLVLAYQTFVAPFSIWILRDFFGDLPPNLEECAQVYGCSQFQAFMRVVLPLAAPGLVAVGFLAFLIGWSDFLFANMLTTGTGPRTAIVMVFFTVQGGERIFWSWLMAQAIIVGTPPVILYIIGRKYLQEAISSAST